MAPVTAQIALPATLTVHPRGGLMSHGPEIVAGGPAKIVTAEKLLLHLTAYAVPPILQPVNVSSSTITSVQLGPGELVPAVPIAVEPVHANVPAVVEIDTAPPVAV